jgi:hypothetical protein
MAIGEQKEYPAPFANKATENAVNATHLHVLLESPREGGDTCICRICRLRLRIGLCPG